MKLGKVMSITIGVGLLLSSYHAQSYSIYDIYHAVETGVQNVCKQGSTGVTIWSDNGNLCQDPHVAAIALHYCSQEPNFATSKCHEYAVKAIQGQEISYLLNGNAALAMSLKKGGAPVNAAGWLE